MSSTFVALAQPAVGMAFPPALAGRALSAYNLVIFCGVFVVQWGIGLAGGRLRRAGLETVDAFRARHGRVLACSMPSYGYFLWAHRDNQRLTSTCMNAILIIAHAPLAHALRQCALHVFPDCERRRAIDVQPNLSPEETLAAARIALEQLRPPRVKGCWC